MRRRRLAVTVLGTILLLGACDKPKSPQEQASEDARAIAMVEAAQNVKPPPVPLDPQPITAADIEANKLYGAGCTLVPASVPGGDPVVLADAQRAVMKVGGKFVTFAADPGSSELALGARAHYVGKAQSMVIERATGEGSRLGEEAIRWDGRVTVHDANDQLVYATSGALVCGS